MQSFVVAEDAADGFVKGCWRQLEGVSLLKAGSQWNREVIRALNWNCCCHTGCPGQFNYVVRALEWRRQEEERVVVTSLSKSDIANFVYKLTEKTGMYLYFIHNRTR